MASSCRLTRGVAGIRICIPYVLIVEGNAMLTSHLNRMTGGKSAQLIKLVNIVIPSLISQ